nr:MAG TPA: hypothetical protein [Bacteriophage sp.]
MSQDTKNADNLKKPWSSAFLHKSHYSIFNFLPFVLSG